jgi:hypothetical protein
MSIDINVTGINETVRDISNYSNQLIDKVVSLSLRSGANLLKGKLQAAAPINKTPSKYFPAGRLKRSFFFKVSKIHKRRTDGTIGYYIRPKEKGGKGATGGGGRYGNAKNAYYAQMVEDGYEVKGKSPIERRRIGSTGLKSGRKTVATGKMVSGTHFIRNTYNANKSQIESLIKRGIETGANDLARRLNIG